MAIFTSYVSLPEGNPLFAVLINRCATVVRWRSMQFHLKCPQSRSVAGQTYLNPLAPPNHVDQLIEFIIEIRGYVLVDQ